MVSERRDVHLRQFSHSCCLELEGRGTKSQLPEWRHLLRETCLTQPENMRIRCAYDELLLRKVAHASRRAHYGGHERETLDFPPLSRRIKALEPLGPWCDSSSSKQSLNSQDKELDHTFTPTTRVTEPVQSPFDAHHSTNHHQVCMREKLSRPDFCHNQPSSVAAYTDRSRYSGTPSYQCRGPMPSSRSATTGGSNVSIGSDQQPLLRAKEDPDTLRTYNALTCPAPPLTSYIGTLHGRSGTTSCWSTATKLMPGTVSALLDTCNYFAISPQPDGKSLHACDRGSQKAARQVQGQGSLHRFKCRCCFKRPRKFDHEDELRQHENQRRYPCAYCTGRFKAKSEWKRHVNSIHLHKESWSCSAMSSPQAVFYSPGKTRNDPCGNYCGLCGHEFSDDDVDWEVRFAHLQNVHKYKQCDTAKRFWRADHFRQHLKYRHGIRDGLRVRDLEEDCRMAHEDDKQHV